MSVESQHVYKFTVSETYAVQISTISAKDYLENTVSEIYAVQDLHYFGETLYEENTMQKTSRLTTISSNFSKTTYQE